MVRAAGHLPTMYWWLVAMNEAFDAGRRAGVAPLGSAVDCPITHAELMLRMSWMNGFSWGRINGISKRT
ncbi:hypothetical protein HKX05_19760 [Sphingomonas sanguinis]|nr:hypothetical protein [Sphingomonas sanguinis]NNG55582.1 hypothetical protein [Sphingomonas sanguinis]